MTFEFGALLFDLDGTLISSIGAVDRAWTRWCERNSLDPEVVLPQIHGRRSLDSIRLVAPHLDAEVENLWLRHQEASDTEGVMEISGALSFLRTLTCPWAVVTSGTGDVATARMRAAGLPTPPVTVFGDEVTNGKPAPDPFLLGASRLGVPPGQCIAFEDTWAGIQSGKSAGMKTIALATSLSVQNLSDADAVIGNWFGLSVEDQVGKLWLNL
jgi:mannitol-1-/sugar-/sorbitol-6-phosphatase